MKKLIKMLSMVMVVSMMLSLTAFAAPAGPTLEEKVAETVTGSFADGNQKLTSITYEDGAIQANGQYMIFVTSGNAAALPTANNLLYINQAQAAEAGTITFNNVYPKSMRSSAIQISGAGFDSLKHIADIIAAMLGYVTYDDEIDGADATEILRYAASLESVIDVKDAWLSKADINDDGEIDGADATEILRYAAALESILDLVYPED